MTVPKVLDSVMRPLLLGQIENAGGKGLSPRMVRLIFIMVFSQLSKGQSIRDRKGALLAHSHTKVS